MILLDNIYFNMEWIKNLCSKLLLVAKQILARSIHCDNKVIIEQLLEQKIINKKIK